MRRCKWGCVAGSIAGCLKRSHCLNHLPPSGSCNACQRPSARMPLPSYLFVSGRMAQACADMLKAVAGHLSCGISDKTLAQEELRVQEQRVRRVRWSTLRRWPAAAVVAAAAGVAASTNPSRETFAQLVQQLLTTWMGTWPGAPSHCIHKHMQPLCINTSQ